MGRFSAGGAAKTPHVLFPDFLYAAAHELVGLQYKAITTIKNSSGRSVRQQLKNHFSCIRPRGSRIETPIRFQLIYLRHAENANKPAD